MSLGRNLMIMMYDRRLSHRELAKAAGCTESMISRVISGERDISSEKLKRIAEYLGVSVDELLK